MSLRSTGSFAAIALLVACAQMQAPPGGPEDKQGPRLLTTRPDTFARMESFPGPVVLVFDEGLSEQKVEEAVEVSPRTSAVSVEKRGDEIRVDLRRGWERNRVYQVTVEPIIQDRFSNKVTAPVRLVFSTGPEIPDTRLTGLVIERKTASPATQARVEAILAPDSLIYATRTDSAGRFRFEQIPEGSYRVRAYSDPNGTRALDPFEARDTTVATVAVSRPAELSLSIVAPDSTGPRLASAAAEREQITLRFDDFLDPALTRETARIVVFAPDSTELAVAEFAVGALDAPADSTRADSARRDSAAADSTPRRGPVPAQTLVVRLRAPMAADAQHRVTVTGVRNLVGLDGGGTVQFRSPRAPAPAAAPTARDDDGEPAQPARPPTTEPPARPPR